MALLRNIDAEFPFDAKELEATNILRTEGMNYKFISHDGKEDVVNGVFQLKMVRTGDSPIDLYRFEQFKATQDKAPSGVMLTHIEMVHFHYCKLEFRPNTKSQLIAFCPDTRHNRNLLADIYFDNKYVIEGLLKNTGSIEGAAIKGEIEALALKRRAERQDQKNRNANVVERMYSNLTPEQRKDLIQKLIEEENKNRTIIEQPKQEAKIEVKVEPKVETKPEATLGTANSAVIQTVKVNIPGIPKPEGNFKFFALKKEAKKAVLSLKENELLIQAFRQEYGEKWNSNPKYRTSIQPQIDGVLEAWTKTTTI